MKIRLFTSCMAALLLLPALAATSSGQAVGIAFVPTGADPPGNWTTTANWAQAGGVPALGPPEGQFNEFAGIQSGGIAFINTTIANGVGGMNIGATSELEVRNGGSMTFVKGLDTDRRVVVSGTLNLQGSGTLDVESLLINSSATLDIDLTAATATPIFVEETYVDADINIDQGEALLNGVLDLDFTGIASPSGSYTLIDADIVSGQFTSVVATGLQPKQVVTTNIVSGGTNGTLVQAEVLNALTLLVNRTTGAVSVQNTHGSAISLDGFAVTSASGSLSGSSTALAAGWEVAPGTANTVGQLFEGTVANPSFSAGAGSNSSIGGGLFTPGTPTAFGQDVEDLVFTYTDEGVALPLTGFVDYVGGSKVNNDFVLTVDGSGEATIQNESPFFSAAIEAYRVSSPSGSLVTGTWDEVEGSFGNTWSASLLSDASQLLELQEDGTTTFETGNGFAIGDIVNNGAEDLVFEYLIAGDDAFSEGVVVYGALPTITSPSLTPESDFDGDGDTDGSDFLFWQRNIGTPSALASWQAGYGSGALAGGSAIGAVPEPGSATLLGLAGVCLATALRPKARLCR